jgi:hypothetical protein
LTFLKTPKDILVAARGPNCCGISISASLRKIKEAVKEE